jgi:glycerophosphoryl diester phosphodiesterase
MKKIITLLSVAALTLTSCCKQTNAEVKILAHRGNASTGTEFTTDENTIDALHRAQAENFAGIEFDVHLTADGELVIRHDNKIVDGLSCQGSTFEEIRAHRLPFGHQIPTLREWLVEAKKTPHIVQMLEIKSHKGDREKELIAKSLEIIRELDMVDQMYMLSFKTETVDEVLRQEPKMKVILNSSSLHHSLTPEEVKERGYTAVSYNINVILNHTDWIEKFQQYGIETFLWMVNTPYTLNIAKDLGFTWATTDFIDNLKE